ncbi:MAG: TerB family tellurite resistance protein [Deltaproteobacteria bacterium]|nr:TerB family tellurite resistance protein [Deltaproteobacteria bacterium]
MSLTDRIAPLCDLLLGAAYADEDFKDREREEVRDMLVDLSGAKLTPEIEERIASFDPKAYDLAKTAGVFASDTDDERRRLLFLVAAVNDADDEIDFAEDEYLRALANALFLPADALKGMTIEMEEQEQREVFQQIRKGPPPPPIPKKAQSVDVDVD